MIVHRVFENNSVTFQRFSYGGRLIDLRVRAVALHGIYESTLCFSAVGHPLQWQ